jgi:PAS domain S-box-containing protein
MYRTYDSIVHMLPDIIYKLDSEGCFTYINNSIRNLGYEPDDLLRKHFSHLIHPEDLDNIKRDVVIRKINMNSYSSDGPPKFFDERRTGKRITRDLQIRLKPKNVGIAADADSAIAPYSKVIAVGSYHSSMENVNKEFTGTLGVIKHVVEIKKSEDTLLRCLDYYHSLVEMSADTFIVMATDGTILFTSPSLRRSLGYSSDSIAGENIIDYIHQEDFKGVIRSYCLCKHDNPVFNLQCRILSRDNEWRSFDIKGKAAYDDHGRAMYITVTTHDITKNMENAEKLKKEHLDLENRVAERTAELASANKQLKAEIENRNRKESIMLDSELKYRSLVNSIDDVVLNIDPEGIILFVNPAIERIAGHSPEEIIDRNLMEFIHPDDMDGLLKSMRHARDSDPDDRNELIKSICDDTELRIMKKDGTCTWIEIRCRAVKGSTGAVLGYRGIAHDITRRKQAEEEMARESKIESLGILAAGIAHDFNNLLTVIMGNISLARVNLPPENAGYGILSEAEKASVLAKNLTRQLMAFSKGGTLEKRVTSIQNLLVDTAYFVLRGSPIKCNFYISDSLWDAEIDRGQIGQVIHNIILNARQAMPSGGAIMITAGNIIVRQKDGLPLKDGKYINISIADQGPGIPEDIISKIFDPYFSTKDTGSGLGLAISYSIIKKHQGHISVESKNGKGTAFSLYLPASRQKAVMRLKTPQSKTTPGGKILLMDDEKIILDLGGRLLGHLGYQVVTAVDGVEAGQHFREAREEGKPFDLVILDLIIPDNSGADRAIEMIKGLDPQIKVIVTSGYADHPVMLDFKSHGFCGALTKPFNLDELEQVLARVLKHGS